MINLKKTKESIVLITSAIDKKANVIGTGFPFYKEKNYTYLLTCAHVVEDVGENENVLVNKIPAEVLAIGDVKGFDLAVLRIKEPLPFPILRLMILDGEEQRSFQIKISGYFLWGENKAFRRQTIKGIMKVELDGERALQIIENFTEEVAVGKLQIDKGKLQSGYSGAPVIDLETGFVVGVTTHKDDEEGKFGTAISIEALEKIWREMPTELSQEIKRESLETSDNLPAPETPVELLKTSENLSTEEIIPPKQLDIPNNSPAQQITQPFDVITVNSKGEEINRRSHQAVFFTEDLGSGVILEMVSIPGGTFLMGSPENEPKRRDDESPQHQVTLQPFYMSKYPITQNQYQAIMGKNSSHFQGGNRPVECVSWSDATEFCQKLSEKTGENYRLPSESQWEYACRAGTTTPFYFGETITSELVNFDGTYTYGNAPQGEYRQETTDVGSFPPNAFGLYDMHGNVWEWCADDWHDNYEGAPTDGSPWLKKEGTMGQLWHKLTLEIFDNPLLRGGSWVNNPTYCRSAIRFNNFWRDNSNFYIGFRIVCDVGRTE